MSGGFVTPNRPNLPDFLVFLQTVNIPEAALPDDSPYPGYALNQAIALVLQPPFLPGIAYTLACYNCATHLLFVITPDTPPSNYFATMRGTTAEGLGLVVPSTGLVSDSANDQGTSVSLAEPKWAKGLTVGQLGFFKTPWGREYLSYQQSYGPSVWGLT